MAEFCNLVVWFTVFHYRTGRYQGYTLADNVPLIYYYIDLISGKREREDTDSQYWCFSNL